jgi:hypothetical protein
MGRYKVNMKVREFVNELSSLMDKHSMNKHSTYIGYQIIPSLDGDPRKIIWKTPSTNNSESIECTDALAFNLTVLDINTFEEFVNIVDTHYSQCKYASWLDMWNDYLYYKGLDE